jgi:hypothetical protein
MDAISNWKLENGVYVVGAHKLEAVAHAFTMVVMDGEYIVDDDRIVKGIEN